MNRFSILSCLSLLLLSIGCAPSIANLDAAVTPEGDDGGKISSRVQINFTELTTSANSDSNTLTFTNPEGSTMQFILSGNLASGTYSIDGSTNQFSASFVVKKTAGSTDIDFKVTSTFGTLTLTNVGIDQATSQLTSLSGEYIVNFAEGGSGGGYINWPGS